MLNASMISDTSQRQGSLAEHKCILQCTLYSSHITAKPLSEYTEEEKLKSQSLVTLRNITLTFFFSAFIGVVFLRHDKIMKVFYALTLKFFRNICC